MTVLSNCQQDQRSDRIDRNIRTGMNDPARQNTVQSVIDQAEQNPCCRKTDQRDNKQGRCKPDIHDCHMVEGKQQSADDHCMCSFHFPAKSVIQKTAEECFLQERIDNNDIAEDKQKILSGQTFFMHQAFPDI